MERVKDGGKSEGRAVMVRIEIPDLSRSERVPTSTGCNSHRMTVAILVT